MSSPNAEANDWLAQAKELEENLQQSWMPEEPGEAIAGRIVAVDEQAGKNDGDTVVELETEEGDLRYFWMWKVLKTEWKREKPRVGDIIGVKYHGYRKSKTTGREYRSVTLKVLARGERSDVDVPV